MDPDQFQLIGIFFVTMIRFDNWLFERICFA